MSLIWRIRQVIVEHKYKDELDKAEKLFAKYTPDDTVKAELLLSELGKVPYLQPACIRMSTLYEFSSGDLP